MAVPNEMQDIARRIIKWARCHLDTARYDGEINPIEHSNKRVALESFEAWLDAQPQAPQPSWDDAPAEANWWIVHSDGLEEWWHIKNDGYPYADGAAWEVSGAHWADGTFRSCGSGRKHNIDIGIDWRLLKQRRPETT